MGRSSYDLRSDRAPCIPALSGQGLGQGAVGQPQLWAQMVGLALDGQWKMGPHLWAVGL